MNDKKSEKKIKMVKESAKNREKVYLCKSCCLTYKNKKWAEKCGAWCKKHNSCNIEIIKHAIRTRK